MNSVELLATGIAAGYALGWGSGYPWGRWKAQRIWRQHIYTQGGVCSACGRTKEFNDEHAGLTCMPRGVKH